MTSVFISTKQTPRGSFTMSWMDQAGDGKIQAWYLSVKEEDSEVYRKEENSQVFVKGERPERVCKESWLQYDHNTKFSEFFWRNVWNIFDFIASEQTKMYTTWQLQIKVKIIKTTELPESSRIFGDNLRFSHSGIIYIRPIGATIRNGPYGRPRSDTLLISEIKPRGCKHTGVGGSLVGLGTWSFSLLERY